MVGFTSDKPEINVSTCNYLPSIPALGEIIMNFLECGAWDNCAGHHIGFSAYNMVEPLISTLKIISLYLSSMNLSDATLTETNFDQ